MPEINLFNGGINIHKDSRKLEANEFTQILDANITSGSIVSIPEPIQSNITDKPIGAVFTEYKGDIVSGSHPYLKFERMQNKLFKSDGSIVNYTEGLFDVNGNLIWTELGLPTPEDAIIAKVLESTEVTFTPTAVKGVTEIDTYYYIIVVDDTYAYSVNYVSEVDYETVTVDTSAITATTVDVYRYWKDGIYFISSDRIFEDFAADPAYFSTPVEASTLYTTNYITHGCKGQRHYGVITIKWLGDGKVNVRSTEKVDTNKTLNMIDGTQTGSGSMTIVYTGSDSYTGYATFRCTQPADACRDSETMFIFDVNINSYRVISAPYGNRYPNFKEFEFINGTNNSRGALLDIETTYNESKAGDFSYQLTYADAGDQETTGGPTSNIVSSRGSDIEITIPAQALDGAVTNVHLYRQNSAVVNGYFRIATFTAAEIEAGVVYIDNVLVENLGQLVPNRTLSEVPSDSLFPTAVQGRLFLATKDDSTLSQDYSKYLTLRWSHLGNALSWTTTDFLNVDHPITGLGSCANGLILYHRESSYILQSIQTEIFNYRVVSQSQGCIDHRSIQSWGGYSICASLDGISITDGSTTTLLSYNKLGILPLTNTDLETYDTTAELLDSNVISSAVVGNQYFLLLKDSNILRVDLLTNVFTYISSINIVGIGHINGELYTSDLIELLIAKYDIEGFRTYKVETGDITEGAMCNLKEYEKVRVSMSGKARLNVYLDSKLILENIEIKKAEDFIGIPNENNKGYAIRFEVNGVGTLHGIEYTLMGRANG